MYGKTCRRKSSSRSLLHLRLNPATRLPHLYFRTGRFAPHEKRILSLLKADEATHIDELVEPLENEMSSSEIFAALFELELTGKVRQMPGKNFVKRF
jgi:predicted Rossmann fold nucleotide-binding protein DprA/Smf involved in DNA uptake